MPTNRANIKSFGSKTLIIIVGILVALMISINSGLIKISDLNTDHKNISSHLKELLAAESTEESGNKLPSFLQLSQDLHNLYKKVRN